MIHRPFEPSLALWPLGRFLEYARNPCKNDGAVDRMCDSIREFGFKIPAWSAAMGNWWMATCGSRPRASSNCPRSRSCSAMSGPRSK